MSKPLHRPKGSMCMACTHSSRIECWDLDFTSMPVMYRENSDVVVRCTDFTPKPSQQEPEVQP